MRPSSDLKITQHAAGNAADFLKSLCPVDQSQFKCPKSPSRCGLNMFKHKIHNTLHESTQKSHGT